MKNLNLKYQPFTKVFRHFFVGIFLLAIAISAHAQNKTVSGFVHDQNKVGLYGVTVTVKGTKTATSTDFDGRFKITASPNDQLVFSYIGFETRTLTVGNSSSLDISLAEVTSKLNEVVVVGYGTQKKANLTGAVSTVSAKTIENRPVTNVANALQGAVPGMNVTRTSGQPGNENMAIQIRGASSANGAVNPLLVIDGVTTDLFNLQTINPADVESISVLKDGAAAAIYGARSAGGVILVTTKKGKEGKTVFEYTSMLAVQKPMIIPKRMSLYDEAIMANYARTNKGLAPEYSDADLDIIRRGIPWIQRDPIGNPNSITYFNTHDFSKDLVKENSVLQTHNLSARGGTDKVNYLFSLGYMDQGGMFKVGADHFKRLNLRMNVGVELNKYIFLDSKISYVKSDTESPSAGLLLNSIYRQRLRNPLFTPDGHYNGSNMLYARLAEGGTTERTMDDMDANFQMTIKDVVKGLKFRAIYGHKLRSDDTETFDRTVQGWGMIAPTATVNNPNSYDLRQTSLLTNNMQFIADYDLAIGEDHKFAAMAGFQYEDYRSSTLNAGATAIKSNDMPTLNLGDASTKTNSQSINTFASQSLFGRINYAYKDKYLAEFVLRTDESSRLAPESRKKTFPSASIGWVISKEEWFSKNLPFVSQLKPRFSWGTLGNADGIGYYDFMNMLANNNNLVLGGSEARTSYFVQNTTPSSDLSWETIETFNYGIDFGFFQNKLTGTFDYYTKENKNMLTPLRLPATFGVGTPKINNGVLETKGWEVSLNYRDKIGDDFRYGIGFNIDNNTNKLVSYAGVGVIGVGTNNLIEGYPLMTIWGYATKPGYIQNAVDLAAAPVYSPITGIGDIAYVDQNGDNKVNAGRGTKEDYGDLVNLGTDQQQYNFGVNANASWKNLDFSMMIQGVGKRAFMPNLNLIEPLSAAFNYGLPVQNDYWTPNNTNAKFPRPYLEGHQSYAASDRWILDGAYARLKNIQFGYSLSQNALSKMFFTKVRLFVSGENIATVSKLGIWKTTFDPEQRNGTETDYPLFGTVSLGVNLLF